MPKRHFLKDITYWNRKLHIHLGLFLILFIWLFSLSGLLLNHSSWKFTSFWNERKEQSHSSYLMVPNNLDSADLMHYITNRLRIKGEVTDVNFNKDSIDFRSSVPGHILNIHVDFKRAVCIQKEIKFNIWGIMRTLHTFNGVNNNNPSIKNNWILTYVWRFTMDGIAIGLIFLCISSFIMWYKLKKARLVGFLVLFAGFIVAIYFVFLIRMM
jgi:hypothetical protein